MDISAPGTISWTLRRPWRGLAGWSSLPSLRRRFQIQRLCQRPAWTAWAWAPTGPRSWPPSWMTSPSGGSASRGAGSRLSATPRVRELRSPPRASFLPALPLADSESRFSPTWRGSWQHPSSSSRAPTTASLGLPGSRRRCPPWAFPRGSSPADPTSLSDWARPGRMAPPSSSSRGKVRRATSLFSRPGRTWRWSASSPRSCRWQGLSESRSSTLTCTTRRETRTRLRQTSFPPSSNG
mmetsp:Transcript_8317/g.24936  ORF Transcript_8317/g.24936 Transcript_8317/m.24936 type:complete len:238 (+) Transcript_8317:1183-1896(+)